MFEDGIFVDLFAGAGGASAGAEAAIDRQVDIAINHNPVALAVHEANHPHTRHLVTNVWDVDPIKATGGRRVWGLWASPDCTFFSRSKGGKPRSKKIRSLAWVVTRWARAVRPARIFLENVPEFEDWGPLLSNGMPCKKRKGKTFRAWVAKLRSYGYAVEWRVLTASHYGAPTSRKRLFVIARCDGLPIVWPEPTHGPGRLPFNTAASCIDWSIPCPSIFGRKKPLADKTLARVALGIRRFVLENPTPYMVENGAGHALIQTGYGERKGQAPRVLDLNAPLGTVMGGGQKHALVTAFIARHFGGPRPNAGIGLDQPLPTITGTDHHSLVNVALAKSDEARVREVRELLAKHQDYSTSHQSLIAPLRLLREKQQLGIVTVAGVDHQIVDIGLRMLTADELLRAQFGRFAAGYDLSAARTSTAKVLLVGNSVPPEVAEALVRANLPRAESEAA